MVDTLSATIERLMVRGSLSKQSRPRGYAAAARMIRGWEADGVHLTDDGSRLQGNGWERAIRLLLDPGINWGEWNVGRIWWQDDRG